MPVRQALFLVGGKGSRLGALTAVTPKPLLEVAPGVRFIDILIGRAARQGFTDIILLAGHHGGIVEALYHGKTVGDATIRVVREPAPAGTGGALRQVAPLLQPWFVLANGDSIFDIDLRSFVSPAPANAVARIALREVADSGRFGSVALDGDLVTHFHEKDACRSGPCLINGGVYLLGRDICGHIAAQCSLEHDVFPALAARRLARGRVYDSYFLDIGLPDTLAQGRRELAALYARPAAFLDRDGVLNVDAGYTHQPERLIWRKGAKAAVKALNAAGYLVLVVTNQAGVARGYYTETQMRAFHAHMQAELAETGAHIDAFYHCPFHPDAAVPRFVHPDHPDRKPNPGMILRAMADWHVRTTGSFLIGDQPSDVEAAQRAGVPGVLFDGDDLLATVRACVARFRAIGADLTMANGPSPTGAVPLAMEAG